MPLAIIRAQAKDLPLKFTLDDSSAMVAGAKLSTQSLVIVGARISRSGSAVAQTGVHRISIGGLTKDVKAVDFSMRFEN